MTASFTHPKLAPRPPVCYGPLVLSSRYLLSPLAGFTNLPFRRIVREIGGLGLATTDLVSARALLEGRVRAMQLIETCLIDTPFAVQIFGGDAGEMTAAAVMLQERGVDSIDINMGCPVAKVVGSGAGAGMMCRSDAAVRLVEQVVQAVRVPVSVKMRLGWDAKNHTAPEFARAFEQIGVCAVAIHGRTREQGFSGQVDLAGIRRVVEAVRSIPVIGNGDVRTIPDAARMLSETGCHGVSLGRGALANPWIFRQLSDWEQTGQWQPAGTFAERMELLRRQFRYLVEQLGEERAIPQFRKMGHWYLKGMTVIAGLRNEFQQARTLEEFEASLAKIEAAGPRHQDANGWLPEFHVPVPSGPVSNW